MLSNSICGNWIVNQVVLNCARLLGLKLEGRGFHCHNTIGRGLHKNRRLFFQIGRDPSAHVVI